MGLGETVARFMDGQSAEERQVRVSISGGVLVIRAAGEVHGGLRWPIAEVRVDAMHEGNVVHLECARTPDALLTVEDPLFVKGLEAAGVRVKGLAVGRRGLVIGLSCFLGFAALLGGFYAAAPWLASTVARKIPVEVEKELASEILPAFMRRTCSTKEADVALTRMMARLDPEGQRKVEVRIVNLDLPNAFALPGSVVLLTRGLLEEADGPDEVAGVLAHELGHVEHRHAFAHMIRNAVLGAAWALTLGDYSGLMVVDPRTAYETATLKFSRDAEAEADDAALGMLYDRGIPARGLANFLERNSKGEVEETEWFSTHPASKERIARLTASEPPARVEPVLDVETFYHLRKACEGMPPLRSIQDLFF